jgi:hypothetical protein
VVVGERAWRSEIPRWLVPAVAGWSVLVVVAAGALGGWAVDPRWLFGLAAVAAMAHGWVRRWRVAGPVAVVMVALAVWPLGLPAYEPAGTAGPKLIWTAAVLVAALDIDVALVLHARHRRRLVARTAVHLPGQLEPLGVAD